MNDVISKEEAVKRCLPAIKTILLEKLPSKGTSTKMSRYILQILESLSKHTLEAIRLANKENE